jgi:ribosomal protein L32
MGAVPKNKITRAERGKRRQGNRPSLKKNLKQTSIPLHKRGLVAQIFKTLGIKE